MNIVSNCTNFSNRKFIRPYFDGISTVVTQYQVVDELGQFWFQGTLSDCETYLNQKKDDNDRDWETSYY